MRSKSGGHPQEEVIELYSLGKLNEEESLGFEEHLLMCPTCQDKLAEADLYVKAMKLAAKEAQSPGYHPPVKFFRRFILAPHRVWVAACVVSLFAVAFAFHRPADSPETSVMLQTARGSENGLTPASRGTPLQLKLDVTQLAASSSYRLELVNEIGKPVWSGSAQPQGSQLTLHTGTKLNRGRYWARLYSSTGELLREYGLKMP